MSSFLWGTGGQESAHGSIKLALVNPTQPGRRSLLWWGVATERRTEGGVVGCWVVNLTQTQVDISHPGFSTIFFKVEKQVETLKTGGLCVCVAFKITLSFFIIVSVDGWMFIEVGLL